MKAAHGELAGHVAFKIKIDIPRGIGRIQLNEQPIRVEKAEKLFIEPVGLSFDNQPFAFQPLVPIIDRSGRDRPTDRRHLPRSPRAASRAWPGEKSNNRSRFTSLIAKIKMITCRVVEVDGALDETKPEHLRVKVEVALRVARNGG